MLGKKYKIKLRRGVSFTELVTNGGFEENDGENSSVFTGWTVQSTGAGTWFAQEGTIGPSSIDPDNVSPPPVGTFAAMTGQESPTSAIMYQDVAIPDLPGTYKFSAMVFIENFFGTFATPDSLGINIEADNQQARIDVIDPNADLLTVDPNNGLLKKIFRTEVGDPPLEPYKSVTADLTRFAGTTIRLRLAEIDNDYFFNFGVDSVSIKRFKPTIIVDSFEYDEFNYNGDDSLLDTIVEKPEHDTWIVTLFNDESSTQLDILNDGFISSMISLINDAFPNEINEDEVP